MAMLGESMHARPDGLAAADHESVDRVDRYIGASHDPESVNPIMRLPVAARLATDDGRVQSLRLKRLLSTGFLSNQAR